MPSPYSRPIVVGDVQGDGRDDVVWIEDDQVVLRNGRARGLGRAQQLHPWPRNRALVVTRLPGEPATLWLFAPLEETAFRVEGGRVTEVRLAAP